jgi:hypothetical protein
MDPMDPNLDNDSLGEKNILEIPSCSGMLSPAVSETSELNIRATN